MKFFQGFEAKIFKEGRDLKAINLLNELNRCAFGDVSMIPFLPNFVDYDTRDFRNYLPIAPPRTYIFTVPISTLHYGAQNAPITRIICQIRYAWLEELCNAQKA